MRGGPWVVLSLAITAGCNDLPARTAWRAAESARDGTAGAPRAPSVSATASAAEPPPATFPRARAEEGCARDWSPKDADLDASLAAAARTCAAGLAPALPEAVEVVVEPGHAAELAVTLDAPACLRAIAVASEEGFELSLWDHSGRLGGASTPTRLVVAPSDGPVCVREPGRVRVVLARAWGGLHAGAKSRARVNVWVTKGE